MRLVPLGAVEYGKPYHVNPDLVTFLEPTEVGEALRASTVVHFTSGESIIVAGTVPSNAGLLTNVR